jgi:heterotetrameric sarcosine oxidase gamma subunit
VARLVATPALRGLGLPLAVGRARLSEADPGPVASVAPFRGREAAVARALGMPFPAPGQPSRFGEARLVWAGPGRALLLGRPAPDGLGEVAAVVDQSDAQACVLLEGPAARDVLARLVPLDLREAAFPEGASARTLLGHMTVTLLRAGPDAYEVMAFRSMAQTLAHEVAAAMRGVAARDLTKG